MITPRQGKYALGAVAAYEGALAVQRFSDRKQGYLEARARANATQRQLVVIGDPDGGAHTRLLRAYPCGDVTIDLHGAPACPAAITADITKPVTQIQPNSSVVFVSCVFEYVDDPVAAYNECLRMAGSRENLFIVRVQPWSFTSHFYPGAKWVMFYNDDGTPYFVPMTLLHKTVAGGFLAALGYAAWKGI